MPREADPDERAVRSLDDMTRRAERVARHIEAVRADVERKRAAGLLPQAGSEPGERSEEPRRADGTEDSPAGG